MGDLPEKWRSLPLDPKVEETVELPLHVRRKVSFRAEPADRVTAYLLVPKSGIGPRGAQGTPHSGSREKLPAMLCLHQTTAMGKDEPAGLGGNSDLHYAAELAERGYVTLAPDYWTFGDYREKTYDPYEHGYSSGTMKGIWNHIRSVDFLASLEEVDPERIGCIGHSLGGHNALWLGVFEPRLKVFVSSCGFSSLSSYAASPYGGGDLKNYAQRRYLPRIAEVYGNDPRKVPFDFTEVLGALAPRPVFVNAPLGDDNFLAAGVRECVEAAEPVYELLGGRGKIVAVYPEGGHSFPEEVRKAAYEFIQEELGKEKMGEEEVKREKGKRRNEGKEQERE
jgi:dienelactone hydrolase